MVTHARTCSLILLIGNLSGFVGCESDDPETSDEDPTVGIACALDATPDTVTGSGDSSATPSTCTAESTDYLFASKDSDAWPSCASDTDDAYQQVVADIPSTIARTQAFETIRGLVAHVDCDPSVEAFTQAQAAYLVDQGIQSRVTRRADYHFLTAPFSSENPGDTCRNRPIPAEFDTICMGPNHIEPILSGTEESPGTGAFTLGKLGTSPRVQGARIEAAMIWFFYLSVYAEMHSGRESPKDADSMWAYYTGGEVPGGGIGFSSYVRQLDPTTHDRVWDGMRAYRCWRNLVGDETVITEPVGDAADDDRFSQAAAQVDRAALRGVALIVRKRLQKLDASVGLARQAHWAFLQVLGPLLERGATLADAAAGATLSTEFAKTNTDEVDVEAAIAAIDTAFPCP